MSTRALTALIVAVLLALTGTAAALAASTTSGSRQSDNDRFTTARPGASAGLRMRIAYRNPADPAAKPPAVRKIFTTLQPGTQIDSSVPARCAASDAQLTLQGAAACPARSRVGTGQIVLATGLPGPAATLVADVVLINNAGQLIFVTQVRGTPVRQIVRAAVSGSTITVSVPFQPGTPPDGAALRSVELDIAPIAHGGAAYIRTPPTCPRSGHWTNAATFTYADGVSQTTSSPSACIAATRGRRHVRHVRRAHPHRRSVRPRFTG